MDIPTEVIEAVKPAPTPKARKPYVKKITKRILHAIGNGLRTSSSIANALGIDKGVVQRNLFHIKAKGLVYSSKQDGKVEHKYHLTTDKPKLDGVNIDTAHKKRKSTYNKDGVNTGNTFNTPPKESTTLTTRYIKDLEMKLHNITSKQAQLEHALAEKDKEVWTLECEVFDKKAVIKYLEEKLFQLGVRV